MATKESKRDQFSSQWGFILACIGSAVGMGNIWLFPFRAGQFGGAAFLIPYIIFVIVIGYTGIVEEMCLGRAMRTGPHGAFLKATQMRGNNSGAVIGFPLSVRSVLQSDTRLLLDGLSALRSALFRVLCLQRKTAAHTSALSQGRFQVYRGILLRLRGALQLWRQAFHPVSRK